MIPDGMLHTSQVRTPTGPGLVIKAEGDLLVGGFSTKLAKGVSFQAAPASARAGAGFKVVRTIQYADGKPPRRSPVGQVHATQEDAVVAVLKWVDETVRLHEPRVPKRSLIEPGLFFEGGRDGTWLRKVVSVSGGGMVHWCDFAGMGSCWDSSFAQWMKRPAQAPDPKEVELIEAALAQSGVSMGSMALADALVRSFGALAEDEPEVDDALSPKGP
jgi:hypothetical protein